MLGSSCNDKSCPGWLAAIIVGMIGYIFVTIMFWKDVHADVRVDIYRDLPEGQRIVVQEFGDQDSFEMWMATRLEEGCLPGVKKVEIDFDYSPTWKK